jgi:hypothetical protein
MVRKLGSHQSAGGHAIKPERAAPTNVYKVARHAGATVLSVSKRPHGHFETRRETVAAEREIDAIIARLDVEIPRAREEMNRLLDELRRPAAAA